MDYRFAVIGDIPRMADRHPELVKHRPDLAKPAFLANPVPYDSDFPFIFYVVDGGQIVGSRRAIPDRANLLGREVSWAWCFDTSIDGNHHGKGIGSRLVQLQVEAFDNRGIVSGAAFSAPAMMRIYQKLGYFVLDPTPRMARVRNAHPFLARRMKNSPFLRLATMSANMVLASNLLIRGFASSTRQFSVHEIDKKQFVNLYNDSAVRYQENYWADANWIIARLGNADSLLQIKHQKSQDPSAVFVLRNREQVESHGIILKRLSIMHFALLDKDSSTPSLLPKALLRQMDQKRTDVGDIITSSPIILNEFYRYGFRQRGEGMTFVYKIPKSLDLPAASDIKEWELTHFCSDGFLFD